MFKKSDIDIVTRNPIIHKEFPVIKYSKLKEEWAKKAPLYLDKVQIQDTKTFRGCPGINDWYQEMYIVRWNFDLEIHCDKETDTFTWYPDVINENTFKKLNWFESNKYGLYTPQQDKKRLNTIIKIDLHWDIVSKDKNAKVLLLDPFYNYNFDYRITPGVMKPKYSTPINIIIEPLVDVIKIKKGEIALGIIPLNNKKLNCSIVNKEHEKIINKAKYYLDTSNEAGYIKHIKDDK